MTEEARTPVESAGDDTADARPRPRRRSRGSRGRGRGASSRSRQGGGDPAAQALAAEAAPEPTPSPPERPTGGEGAGGETLSDATGAPGKPSGARRRRRRGGRSSGRSEGSASGDRPPEKQGDAAERRARATDDQPERGAEAPGGAATGTEGRPRGAKRAQEGPEAAEADADAAGTARKSSSSRRRRRRRKPAAGTPDVAPHAAEASPEEAASELATAVAPKRQQRAPKATSGPTRTSRPARRGAADRRRQAPVQVVRRTEKTMLMTEDHGRLQIVVLEGRDLVEHYVARTEARSMVGNIYVGRVQNVLPGMEAAFVDVGRGRNAVLYAGEVSYDEDVEAGQRRIEEVLKAGQSVLVQVTKDPLKGKGARLTAQVSLPGRYLVYVPDGGASGISRRLPDPERERLRKIMKRIRPSEAGVIVRTAAEGASEEELAADLDRLKKLWEAIKRKSRRARPPKALYEEPELAERVVRDVFSPVEFQDIVTDSPEVFERVTGYLRQFAPDLVERVKLHDGRLSLFEAFHVSEQIHKALERKVWLPSGGHLVIDRTEAMTVIDVNTGKAVGKTNLEQTVTATNLEAAKEIPRQLRLRDIGGIIVIDFIDMMLQSNRSKVIEVLREELAHDKTRSQVFDITPLGLLELTRKKVAAGLLEAFSEPCPKCEGRGILLTHEA